MLVFESIYLLFIYLFTCENYPVNHRVFCFSSSSFFFLRLFFNVFVYIEISFFNPSFLLFILINSIRDIFKTRMASSDDDFNKLDTLSDDAYLKLIQQFYDKV